ncbi:Y' element ATP-dependent helicase YJL225C-like [Drosophila guanche]|uniref:Uncharacterized protein n=1 Tax=Drosophila guanche TaxID=7266 RepID=A0A3B0IYE7_DROGU|nr:Y' element ATP-dependent helicase YJL225C-like [Drosophila guanche]SPP72835.1 Hypothetical predicted protein [Drosophila guanche]
MKGIYTLALLWQLFLMAQLPLGDARSVSIAAIQQQTSSGGNSNTNSNSSSTATSSSLPAATLSANPAVNSTANTAVNSTAHPTDDSSAKTAVKSTASPAGNGNSSAYTAANTAVSTAVNSSAESSSAAITAQSSRSTIKHIRRRKRETLVDIPFDFHTKHLSCDVDVKSIDYFVDSLYGSCIWAFNNRFAHEGFWRVWQIFRLEAFMFGQYHERMKRYEIDPHGYVWPLGQ